MRRGWLYGLLGAALCGAYTLVPIKTGPASYQPLENTVLIAHAGGGLEQGRYTNSREALDMAVEHGFRYIELDFSSTKNGGLVLLHSWHDSYFRDFSRFPRLPMILRKPDWVQSETVADFKSLSMRKALTQMSLDDLFGWMTENPEIFIITDVKSENITGLTQIKERAGGLLPRFIPQIYTLEEFAPVKALGFEEIILTTYRLPISEADLSNFYRSHDLFALTLPQSWVEQGIATRLSGAETPIFTHTVNDPEIAKDLTGQGISGFYTDFLMPSSAHSAL